MDELNNLNDLINETAEEIKKVGDKHSQSDQGEQSKQGEQSVQGEQTERKRKELILLSSDGGHSKSVAFLEKASAKVIEKLYAEYEAKKEEKNTVFLCNLAISKFASLLGDLDAVEKPGELEKELKGNPLLQKDLKLLLTYITPFIPLLGVLSSGVIVGKHLWDKSKQNEQSNQSEKVEE